MIFDLLDMTCHYFPPKTGQVNSPEVVEVMELRRGQEGEVISTVGDSGANQSYAVPHGGRGQVGAQEDRPESHRQHVGDLTEEKTTACLMRRPANTNILILSSSKQPSHLEIHTLFWLNAVSACIRRYRVIHICTSGSIFWQKQAANQQQKYFRD